MKKPISMIILAMGLTCSAEPQAVTILSPEAPEGHFEMGREYITLSNGNIGAELGFDGTCEENLVFDLVIFNNSGRPLSFDPSDFYYELLESADADSPMLPPRMARDPEEILDRYEEELEEAEMEKGFNTFLGIVESGIGIINYGSAFVATKNPACIVDALFYTVGTAHHYAARDRRIVDEMEQITNEREVVGEEILRGGQIPTGKVVSGFVFFPRHSHPGYLMFCFPLGDQLFQFVYHQQPGCFDQE
jgi:hypothetical protein